MAFREASGLRFFQFKGLTHPKLNHGVFTRRGGVSPPPWASLNLGGTVGDDSRRVAKNRERVIRAAGRSVGSEFEVWQVHSSRVVRAWGPQADRPLERADAIVTDRVEVTLLLRFADCVPVLVFDPVRNAIGLGHAGWQGTVKGLATALVQQMQAAFGSRPADLVAGIGPSIGPDHYPIGTEVVEAVQAAFGEASGEHLLRREGAVHFNLWSANQSQLEAAGVGSIELSGICTACQPADWFSHRGEAGATGRFGAILGLNR